VLAGDCRVTTYNPCSTSSGFLVDGIIVTSVLLAGSRGSDMLRRQGTWVAGMWRGVSEGLMRWQQPRMIILQLHLIIRSLNCSETTILLNCFLHFRTNPLPSSHVGKSKGMSFMYIVVRYHELMMEAESRLKPSQTIKEKRKKKNAKRLYPDFRPFRCRSHACFN
jgi:hypothetical protein